MIAEAPPASSEPFPNRKRWTRAECDELERYGFLDTIRYELIDGEIVLKVGQSRPHSMVISRVAAWLFSVFGGEHVQSQADIEVAQADQEFNYPQPDAAVVRRPDYEYTTAPQGVDLHLAVEVADTTLRGDLKTKADLYARAGVPEYWVFDVPHRSLIVHRDPTEGRYRDVKRYAETESVAPVAAPSRPGRVADLLPPVPADKAPR
jgi:Uma2 family endonuclease